MCQVLCTKILWVTPAPDVFGAELVSRDSALYFSTPSNLKGSAMVQFQFFSMSNNNVTKRFRDSMDGDRLKWIKNAPTVGQLVWSKFTIMTNGQRHPQQYARLPKLEIWSDQA